MGTTADKLTYLATTKSQLKTMLQYANSNITSSTTFRAYVSGLFQAYINILNTPENIFSLLPKITTTPGTSQSINNTIEAPMKITLSPSELTQASTPTPSSPQDIHSVSGDNTIKVSGKNIINTNTSFTPSQTGWYGLDNIAGFYNQTQIEKSKIYVDLIGGQTYTLSLFEQSNVNTGTASPIQLVNNTGSTVIASLSVADSFAPQTFTPSTNVRVYPRMSVSATNTLTKCVLQLEIGNRATTYEAFNGTDYSVNLGVENLFNEYKITATATGTNNNGVITSTENTTAGTKNTKVYYSNDTISVKAGQTVYFSADMKLDGNSTGTFGNLNDGINGGTTKIVNPILSHNYQRYQTSFTYSADTTLNAILLQVSSLVGTFTAKNIQISFDKSPSYSEYGVEPINYSQISTYKDEFIRTSGKNLFDNSKVEIGKAWHGGTAEKRARFYIKLPAGTDYSIRVDDFTNLNEVAIVECASIDPPASTTYYTLVKTSTFTMTHTFDSSATYLCIQFQSANTFTQTMADNIKLMLNLGTTALSYEPYGNGTWYIKKNIGKVVLDGTEGSLELGGQIGTTDYYRFVWRSTTALNDSSLANTITTKSNYFKGGTFNERNSDYNNTVYQVCNGLGSNNNLIGINTNVATTLADFKTWLNTHNTIIYYLLATPTYTQITGTLESQLEDLYNAQSKNGTTNISQINNDLQFILNSVVLEDLS